MYVRILCLYFAPKSLLFTSKCKVLSTLSLSTVLPLKHRLITRHPFVSLGKYSKWCDEIHHFWVQILKNRITFGFQQETSRQKRGPKAEAGGVALCGHRPRSLAAGAGSGSSAKLQKFRRKGCHAPAVTGVSWNRLGGWLMGIKAKRGPFSTC